MIKIKIFLSISFLFFTSMMSFGQMKITEEGYSKAVDLANYTYVKYSMPNKEAKDRFLDRCNCNDDPSFEAIQNAIDTSFVKTIEFSKEYNELKNEKFNLTQNNIAKFLTDSIFSEAYGSKYELIVAYGKKRSEEKEFIRLKRDLSDKITNSLNNYMVKESTVSRNEAVTNSLEPTRSANETRNKRGWFDGITYQIDVFSILISILISVVLIVFIYVKYLKSENVSKDYVKKKISDLKFEQTPNNNRSEITTLKNEILGIKNQLQKLQNPKVIESQKIEYVRPIKQELEKKQDEYFYLSTPNSEGSFNESSMKFSFNPGATIYKFKKENTDNKASFIIDEREDAVKLALQYPSRNIEPCCEATNGYNANATNIITTEPGIAELNNGVWKITSKAKITYEN